MQGMDLVHVEIPISWGVRSSLNTNFMSGESTCYGIFRRFFPFMDLRLGFRWLGVISLSSRPTVFFPKSMLSYSFTLLAIPFPALTEEKHLSHLACISLCCAALGPKASGIPAKGTHWNISEEVWKGQMTAEQLTPHWQVRSFLILHFQWNERRT